MGPVCWCPARLNGECYWANTFGELNVKICEETANIRIKSTLQTKRSIEPSVVTLLNRIHVYVLDRACICYDLKYFEMTQSTQYDPKWVTFNTNLFHIHILQIRFRIDGPNH